MPAKSRLAKATWWTTPESGFCCSCRRNIDEMHHGLAFAVHPGPGKREVRPVAFGQSKDVLVEPNGVIEFSGPDIEVIEYAHAHAMPLP
jgi:hypothetical protein